MTLNPPLRLKWNNSEKKCGPTQWYKTFIASYCNSFVAVIADETNNQLLGLGSSYLLELITLGLTFMPDSFNFHQRHSKDWEVFFPFFIPISDPLCHETPLPGVTTSANHRTTSGQFEQLRAKSWLSAELRAKYLNFMSRKICES